MSIVTMRPGPDFVISEANNVLSRAAAVIANPAATPMLAGTILGRLTAATAVSSDPTPTNTGNPTFGAINAASTALIGVYLITFLTATTFSVRRPDGAMLANGSTGVAYNQGGLTFTLTAGGTAAVAGDNFNITVSQRVGDFVRYNPALSNGAQTIAGISYQEVDPVTTIRGTVYRRSLEVFGSHLTYHTGATVGEIATANAALLALGIVVR